MAKVTNSNQGKHSRLIATAIEKDLVGRIDVLAKRDGLTRSTWMREAIILAWKNSYEFKRTPIHGYLATPIENTSIQHKSLNDSNMGGGG